jgi:hypothetical protein
VSAATVIPLPSPIFKVISPALPPPVKPFPAVTPVITVSANSSKVSFKAFKEVLVVTTSPLVVIPLSSIFTMVLFFVSIK